MPLDPARLSALVSALANSLQVAAGLSTQLRRDSQTTSDDTVRLEASLDRAVSTLQQLRADADAETGGDR